ncbi:serine O-acetyltransferase EpsC [Ferriphaselus sp. R-1]|uniref:serine O-acetyltransferase EpsC n=1 Tax=Ferriphaselus sp. R-1 TaxID=1485544 RepID=UPI0005546807|nr:serine O-acetyltransferase EpsC [Ferriphaselus sp. R-1]
MNTRENIPLPTDWSLEQIVAELREVRRLWRESCARNHECGGRELPAPEQIRDIVDGVRGALFPMRLGPPDLRQESEDFFVAHTLDTALHALHQQVLLELHYTVRQLGKEEPDSGIEAKAVHVVRSFAAALPGVRALLDTDVRAAYNGDPAAHSVDEILLCYPGTQAVIHHRLAHVLHGLGASMIARIIAELAHSETGIDIHPGASIGSGFFIDHGTGVVIGETAVIGERVRIYQAVTLGAKRFNVGEDGVLEKGALRHPILEDDVVVYAGATILGRITIGRGSSIGGNVWLTRSVPPGSVITQANSQHELPKVEVTL